MLASFAGEKGVVKGEKTKRKNREVEERKKDYLLPSFSALDEVILGVIDEVF